MAPALLGGITISYMDRSGAHSLRFLPQKELRFIAVVPDQPLSTHKARQAIPQHIPHQDAVFNASRTALYVGALMSGNYQYLNAALEDRLHQPYRITLITGTEAVFEAAKANGAYGAIISGAGSTLMAYVDPEKDCDIIAAAMTDAFEKYGQRSTAHILKLDLNGAREKEHS